MGGAPGIDRCAPPLRPAAMQLRRIRRAAPPHRVGGLAKPADRADSRRNMTPGQYDPIRRLVTYAAALAAVLLLWVPDSGAAQEAEVTLTARQGDLSVTGTLLGFDGSFLRIATQHGELTLPYDSVTCSGAACPDSGSFVPVLRLSGAARLGEVILPALVDGYARARQLTSDRQVGTDGHVVYVLSVPEGGPEVIRFDFHLTSTDDGFADLLANEADIAMTERPLTGEELALARDAGLGQLDAPGRLRLVALDALVPVAAPGQVVSVLSMSQLSRAFAGEVVDWARLGGRVQPITLHLGPEDNGQMQGFTEMVLARSDRVLAPGVVRHPTHEALAQAVVADPGALGVLPFGEIGNTRPLALTGPCGLRGEARPETVMTGDFPLTLPLVLYLPARRLPPAADAFLGWINTSEAQLVLRRAGVTGVVPLPIPLAQQGDRLAAAVISAGREVSLGDLQRMVRVLGKQQRLSPTFRFETGSARLDAVSRSNAVQLAQAIRDGRHRGDALSLVGFSDGLGPAADNRDLAAARAETVRDEILALLGDALPEDVTLEIEAFGEAMPMGCDDTESGRRTNRRVELWVAQRR